MSLIEIIIIVVAIGLVVSAVLLLKQSAKKFNLTDEQLDKINKRNEVLDKEEKKEDQ
jgi:hypothetical protein